MSQIGQPLKIIWGVNDDGTLKFKTESMFKQVILMAHPIGSIYESTDPTSPAVLFGGTWEEMEAGRVLVSSGTATTGTVYTIGATGGEENHKLSIDEIPKIELNLNVKDASVSDPPAKSFLEWGWGNGYRVYTSSDTQDLISPFGGGQPHNNMQPYEVIHRWKRTA